MSRRIVLGAAAVWLAGLGACASAAPGDESAAPAAVERNEAPSAAAASSFPASLLTGSPADGFALAIKLSRLGVKAVQPDPEVLKRLRPVYATNADSLIASSGVIALHFQTIAAANDYWRAAAGDQP